MQYISSIKAIIFLLKDHFIQEIPKGLLELLSLASCKSTSGFMLKKKSDDLNITWQWHEDIWIQGRIIHRCEGGPCNFQVTEKFYQPQIVIHCSAIVPDISIINHSFQLRNYYFYVCMKATSVFGIVNILDNFKT